MSLLLQTHPLEENKYYELKKINDSMSEKIKQNQKQKAPSMNQNGSNISSGLNTDKRNIYNKNYYNEEINSGIFNRNGSQSSLSVDLNRFKINPNNFNNTIKYKENYSKLSNKNNMKINLEENFETFNPRKDQIASINISKGNNNNNNNEILENSNNTKNMNKNKKEERKDAHSLLKNFNPYDITNFLGVNNSTKKKNSKLNFVNNISPYTSNLQMVLYNQKIESIKNQKNPDFLFNQFYQKESRRMIVEYLKVLNLGNNNSSLKHLLKKENINHLVLLKPEIKEKENISLNNSVINNNVENSILNSNKKNDPFSINNSLKSDNLMELSSKNIFNEPNSFKMLNAFLNDMDDESKDKISLITFLSIPRIMKLIISKEQKYSFVFYCSPTNISCLYGIETYIFKWNECQSFKLVGYFDLINVENCYLDNENKKIFYIDLNTNKNFNKKFLDNESLIENNHYCIEADNEETGVNYVQAINFISQLVKFRIYLNKKKEKNKNFYLFK